MLQIPSENHVRVRRLLDFVQRFGPEDPQLYYELRQNKSEHLTTVARFLTDCGTQWHHHAARIVQFVIDRKNSAALNAIEHNQRVENEPLDGCGSFERQLERRNKKRRKVDLSNALRYSESLPLSIRELLPAFDRFHHYTLAYHPDNVRIVRDVRDFLLRSVPLHHRRRAVYYGAGHDILTPIKALSGITERIDFVDHSGFDWLRYPGQDWFRNRLSEYGIGVTGFNDNGGINVQHDNNNIALTFIRSDNAMHARYPSEGTIVYVTGLAGTSGNELVQRHLDANGGAVLTFFTAGYLRSDNFGLVQQLNDQIWYISNRSGRTKP